eukprot:TRINITY_DN62411_c0_g1_i1.p1 TRINITY_DN62411_c0_g1~~TRINITY_DN62411_c0_g1_i1.p1  ORF type:complete len:174 (-),score=29.77 TRINITY_DN62411_c0_g1_i1:84-605(-)
MQGSPSLAMVQQPITYRERHASSMPKATRSCQGQPALAEMHFHIDNVASCFGKVTTFVAAAGLTAMRAKTSGRKLIGALSTSCHSGGQSASKLYDPATAGTAELVSSVAVKDPSLKKVVSFIRIVLALCMLMCLASAAISGNTVFAVQMLLLWNFVRALLNSAFTNEQSKLDA